MWRFIWTVILVFLTVPAVAEEKISAYLKGLDITTLEKITQRGAFAYIDNSVPGRNKPAIVGMLIKATPEQVFDAVADFEHYPDWIPTIHLMKILERTPDHVTVYFKLTILRVGPIAITTEYTVKHTLRKPDRIDITWISGKVKAVNGRWDFIPVKGGKETLAFYACSGDYSEAALGAAFLFGRQPELEPTMAIGAGVVMLEGIKKRVEPPGIPKVVSEEEISLKDLDLPGLIEVAQRGPFFIMDKSLPQKIVPITTGVLIKASLQRVWDTIASLESYSEWIPTMKGTTVLERTADSAKVYFNVTILSLGALGITTNYTVKYTFHRPENKMTISWVKGKVKNFKGTWELFPVKEGKETLAVYTTSGNYRRAALGTSFLFSRQPELQSTFSLLSGTMLSEAIKRQAESKAK